MRNIEVSIITTCKNRLSHLQQTLPLMLQQSQAEVIVVDYGCPQKTGDWVESHYPQVKVIRIDDDPGFKAARARNAGAQIAKGDVLFFVDADILLKTDITKAVMQLPERKPDSFFVDASRRDDIRGTILLPANLFRYLGGYDEAFTDWGGEDGELTDRLQEQGAHWMFLPENYMQSIKHSEDDRLFCEIDGEKTDRFFMVQLLISYRRIVRDLRLLGSPLPLEKRQQLMTLLKKNIHLYHKTGDEKHLSVQVELDSPERGLYQLGFQHVARTMVYRCNLKEKNW